jgi:putative ABC transport system permease protein
MGFGTQQTLTLDDAYAIERECPAVQDVAPTLEGSVQIISGNLNWEPEHGTTPGMLSVRDWSHSSGRGINEEDVKSAAKVSFSGRRCRQSFGGIDPIDQVVRIRKIPSSDRGYVGKGAIYGGPGSGRYCVRSYYDRTKRLFRPLSRYGETDYDKSAQS